MMAKVNLQELATVQLEFLIDKQSRLKHSLGNRLPDGGAKLEQRLEALKSTLNLRRLQERRNEDVRSFIKTSDPCRDDRIISNQNNYDSLVLSSRMAPADPLDSETDVDTLTEQICAMTVKSLEDETDTSELHSIASDEVWHIRQALNLPLPLSAIVHPITHLRWFVFAFYFVADFVYLTLFDCRSSERYLLRAGLQTTWFHRSIDRYEFPTSRSDDRCRTPIIELTSPAETLRDMWNFIGSDCFPIVLINFTSTSPGSVSDLIWFGRLVRTARHSHMARVSMSRDCRFIDIFHHSVSCKKEAAAIPAVDPMDLRSTLVRRCRAITDCMLTSDKQDGGVVVYKPRNFDSVEDFLGHVVVHNMSWMEAPLEWQSLRELKVSSRISESSYQPKHTFPEVANEVLRRLALNGLGRTRLTRLAGLFGWHGFSGLLTTTSSDMGTSTPITSDLETIQQLYRFFLNVYRHLERHVSIHSEDNQRLHRTERTCLSPVRQNGEDGSTPCLLNDRIEAWASSGNPSLDPTAQRQLRVMDMNESIRLMKKVQRDYEEARHKHCLPTYPIMPLSTANLGSYRDKRVNPTLRPSSDDTDSSSDGDDETVSQQSYGFEDVD